MVLLWSAWVFVLCCWLCYGLYGSSFFSFMISSLLEILLKKQSSPIKSIQRKTTWRFNLIANMKKMKLFKNPYLMVQFNIIKRRILLKVLKSNMVKLFIISEKNLLPTKKCRRRKQILPKEAITVPILSSLDLFLQGEAQECFLRISMWRISNDLCSFSINIQIKQYNIMKILKYYQPDWLLPMEVVMRLFWVFISLALWLAR
jgi:hypothetical protein